MRIEKMVEIQLGACDKSCWTHVEGLRVGSLVPCMGNVVDDIGVQELRRL